MLTINYKVPIWTYFSLVKNINYVYEETSTVETKAATIANSPQTDLKVPVSEIEVNLRERILTYYRNELHVMSTKDIAYVYIENAITYVVNMQGERSVANESLDHLFAQFDPHFFFRVNRQIILRVSAIKKILKMGSGLKIEGHLPFDKLIFISKNKTFLFKKWLEGS